MNQFTITRSAKPDWQKSEAKFLMNLIAKEQEASNCTDVTNDAMIFCEEDGEFGSRNETSSPDTYVWRQMYLRSYTFTREEDHEEEEKKMVVLELFRSVSKSVKRWMKMKKGDRRVYDRGRGIDARHKFLFFFGGVKVDVVG
ncbi:hypothetical protein LINPERHAP1_LOCUS27245 [Linum perenne]